MSTKGKNSKRKIRIPNKYKDTVCELNKKKVNADKDVTTEESSEIRVSSDEFGKSDELGKGDNCPKEGQVLETGEGSGGCHQDTVTNGDCTTTISHMREGSVIRNEEMSMAVNGGNCDQNVDNTGLQSKQVPNSNVSQSSMPVNVQFEAVKTSVVDCEGGNEIRTSYANMTKRNQDNMNNKLSHIPTCLTEDGIEVVIFDEEIVKEGSKKWELTACGYFVGYIMYPQELNYHLFRMWGRYGLKSIQYIGNGTYVFKFNNDQGLQTIIENGVWIVNNKPMVVQKWDISVDLNKVEPDVIPVWVKMLNVPLEAWSTKGLSALASRLGKPVIMDAMTTKMCNQGIGRMGYARVLIEVDAKKGLQDSIVIQYCDKDKNKVAEKTVNVSYDWKPPICNKCKVFGHINEQCGLTKESGVKKSDNKDESGYETVKGNRNSTKGVGNQNKRSGQNNVGMYANRREVKNKYAYIPKAVNKEDVEKGQNSGIGKDTDQATKAPDVGSFERQDKGADVVNGKKYEEEFPALGSKDGRSKSQSITQKVDKNRFDVLGSVGNNETLDSNDNQKYQDEGGLCRDKNGKFVSMEENIVKGNEEVDIFIRFKKEEEMIDMFVNNKRNPTDKELETWARYMCEWYQERWEAKWKSKCPIVGRSRWLID